MKHFQVNRRKFTLYAWRKAGGRRGMVEIRKIMKILINFTNPKFLDLFYVSVQPVTNNIIFLDTDWSQKYPSKLEKSQNGYDVFLQNQDLAKL